MLFSFLSIFYTYENFRNKNLSILENLKKKDKNPSPQTNKWNPHQKWNNPTVALLCLLFFEIWSKVLFLYVSASIPTILKHIFLHVRSVCDNTFIVLDILALCILLPRLYLSKYWQLHTKRSLVIVNWICILLNYYFYKLLFIRLLPDWRSCVAVHHLRSHFVLSWMVSIIAGWRHRIP